MLRRMCLDLEAGGGPGEGAKDRCAEGSRQGKAQDVAPGHLRADEFFDQADAIVQIVAAGTGESLGSVGKALPQVGKQHATSLELPCSSGNTLGVFQLPVTTRRFA
ncbi:hypothetical protein D3C81_1485680 [compost metagenome]